MPVAVCKVVMQHACAKKSMGEGKAMHGAIIVHADGDMVVTEGVLSFLGVFIMQKGSE